MIFCLHDKKRYERDYLERLQDLLFGFDSVEIKHKCEHPDNLADLVAADVMVSNLSSFITFFYHFLRPSVHIIPSRNKKDAMVFSQLKNGKLKYRTLKGDEPAYMNDPDDNGGISVSIQEDLSRVVLDCFDQPDLCKRRSAEWIANHIHEPDGNTCRRFYNELKEFAENGSPRTLL